MTKEGGEHKITKNVSERLWLSKCNKSWFHKWVSWFNSEGQNLGKYQLGGFNCSSLSAAVCLSIKRMITFFPPRATPQPPPSDCGNQPKSEVCREGHETQGALEMQGDAMMMSSSR